SRFVMEQLHRDASNARTPAPGPFRSGISPQPAPANAALAPALEALMGIAFRLRMTSLTEGGGESVRDARAFQVDLQYPASRDKAARAAEEARQLGLNRLPGGAGGQQDDPSPGSVPPFSELLRRSLLAASATRAWVNAERGYALVRKVRVPVSLPPLLTVNVAVGDSEEAEWWLPARGADGVIPPGEAHRMAWALAILSRPAQWEVEVHQADTAAQLYEQLGASLYEPGVVSCVYELCGAVFQIRDFDDVADPGASSSSAPRPGAKPQQGHLVSMIKVPQQYWDEQPEPRLSKPPQGSMAAFVTPRPGVLTATTTTVVTAAATATAGARRPSHGSAGGGAAAAPASATVTATAATTTTSVTSASATTAATAAVTATTTITAPSSLARTSRGNSGGGSRSRGSSGGSAGGGGSGSLSAAVLAGSYGISLPDNLDDIFASGLGLGPDSPVADGGAAVAAGAAAGAKGGSAAEGSAAASAPASTARGHPQGPEWVLFNDFSVFPNCQPHEVTATYCNQKLPCLLQYRSVPPPPHLAHLVPPAPPTPATAPTFAAAAASTPPPASKAPSQQPPHLAARTASGGGGSSNGKGGPQRPAASTNGTAAAAPSSSSSSSSSASPASPRLTPDQFRQLCSAPPLQGPMAGLPPFRFRPLDLSRLAPRPGLRFAIDAEFVASSPPESRAVVSVASAGDLSGLAGGGAGGGGGGVDLVQMKQSRLTLARVAVVVAEPGPLAGSCCVDDYVRAVEPVYDYLTRWSGIQPGDLDPAVSRHYTTTLKHTYLKLKYLLDCGCVFVGHDLRKDFRCLNMVVPPEQVIDTSELFRFRGGRKLSLRFLASFLLGACIQQGPAAGSGSPHMMGHHGPMGHHPHPHSHHPHPHHSHGHPHPHPQHPHAHAPQPPQQWMGGHDAIEDARTAMRLYHKYLELVASDSLQRVLHELYSW
ncbi:hypothetical protein Agub_g12963, partial [Astrephomene gubernaculifera]